MAMPHPQTGGWTLDEMHRLPDDGNRYELVHGELLVTPAPTPSHQAIVDGLLELLFPYVKTEGLGRVVVPRSVIRVDGSETEPDLMVRPGLSRRAVDWETAPIPILVVEVLSPSSLRGDRVTKRAFYLDIGVPEQWIIDGDSREVCVVRQGQTDTVVRDALVWHPAGAREALTIDLPSMFRAALG